MYDEWVPFGDEHDEWVLNGIISYEWRKREDEEKGQDQDARGACGGG